MIKIHELIAVFVGKFQDDLSTIRLRGTFQVSWQSVWQFNS
jgi:hypothetical protein